MLSLTRKLIFYRPYSFVVTVATIYCIYNFGSKKKSLVSFFELAGVVEYVKEFFFF